jgi:hypothetical protein
MLVASKKIAARVSRKAEQLAAKRARSQNAHADAIAYCDENKVTGNARAGYIAFASTAMQLGSDRGAIAHAILSPGKTGTFAFRDIAKAAKVKLSDMSRVNLAYIAHNVDFRRALVGFTIAFDLETQTVTVARVASAAPRKPVSRKTAKAVEPVATDAA